ncbi:MAG: hypothetical protein JXA66_01425 [Oligoflexia bacterium]|nr:hypothetical protein [Oligoflexia bacterium]
MKGNVNFSTTLSKETRELLDRFCKRRGIKLNHFVEKAIIAALEDEMDIELIEERELEETVEWKKIA